jgi:SAM-dependent methyltransferase
VTTSDRTGWLLELRRANAEQEAGLAEVYDEQWGQIDQTHRAFVERFLSLLPPGGRVLDAACGTGRFARLVLDRGHPLTCVDHTDAYLAKVLEKAPEAETARHDLQDLPFEQGFDGVMCVDAMEFVPPEDWPVVLERFRRALRSPGLLYATVELVPEAEIRAGDAAALRLGLPVIEDGEAIWDEPDWYYHFYPSLERARAWLADAGFEIVDELEGPWVGSEYAYHHVLARAD